MVDMGGRGLAATLITLFAVAVLILLASSVAEILFLLFIAVLLAVYLCALTDAFVNWLRLPRPAALLIAVLVTITAVVGVGALILPPVIAQTQDLAGSLPQYVQQLEALLSRLAERYPVLATTDIGPGSGGIVETLINDATEFVKGSLLPYLTKGGLVVVELVSVLAMALYFARDPATYKEGLISLVPPKVRHIARGLFSDLGNTMRAWISAQLLAMFVLAVLTTLGLWILRVPYFLAFGVFTGAVAIVPFFGTIVSTLLPALFVLATGGWVHGLVVALLGVVIHLIEANVVAPLIFAERISVPPVLTIVSVLAMAALIGALGLVVAVPLLAAILVVIRHVLIWEIYGDIDADAVPPAVLVPTGESKAISAVT